MQRYGLVIGLKAGKRAAAVGIRAHAAAHSTRQDGPENFADPVS
jgi:hypothetical protein